MTDAPLALYGLLVASTSSWIVVIVYALCVGALVGWKNLGGTGL